MHESIESHYASVFMKIWNDEQSNDIFVKRFLIQDALKGFHNNVNISFFQELYKEYNNLQLSTNKRITELESRDLEMSRKLTTYEKMEDELDSVIMQAAECKFEDLPSSTTMKCHKFLHPLQWRFLFPTLLVKRPQIHQLFSMHC